MLLVKCFIIHVSVVIELLHTYVLENHKEDVRDVLLQSDGTEHFAVVIK